MLTQELIPSRVNWAISATPSSNGSPLSYYSPIAFATIASLQLPTLLHLASPLSLELELSFSQCRLPTSFTCFEKLPKETQIEIQQEAIEDKHVGRVVLVINSTKHVALSERTTRPQSRLFSVCKTARNIASTIYDAELLIFQTTRS
ncbi:hypothetical protein PG997_008691 [Apiospora hydei]|uniref:2EXR domain-containing protein n=1 Tax=Apiospora hydei TaxID=1337664 RepID=A0ABR1WBR1_9PEZI